MQVTCPGCKGTGRRAGGPLDLPCSLCMRTGKVDEADLERFKRMLGITESEQLELELVPL